MSTKNGQLHEMTKSMVWVKRMIKSTVWVTIFINLLLCVFGQLVTPQDVKLTSENFRYIVTWKPGVGASPDTRYTVEVSNLNNAQGKFTPVKRCTNITAHSCDLSRRFKSFSNLYWAQVKSVTNQSESSWVESMELLPIRDTIVGPPIVKVESNLKTIEVTLDMPLTPHKQEDSHKLKTLRDIDPYLIYVILFVDENGKEYTNSKVKPDKSGKGYYRFENLKSNFTYCVVARFESLHNYHMKDSRKICITTSTQNTDILWIAPLVAGGVFMGVVIITGIVIWMMKEFTYLHLVQSDLPKSLVIISQELHVNLQCKELDENPEADHISFITHSDYANDYNQKSQRIHFTTSLTGNMDENVYDQSSELNCTSYECNRLLKVQDGCTDKENECIPISFQTSTENGSSSNITPNISLGVPGSSHLLYRRFSSDEDTEDTSRNNTAKDIQTTETVHHQFDSFQENNLKPTEIEIWKCADIHLSSVKLFINDDAEWDNLEADSSAGRTSDQLSTDDLCSPVTSLLTTAINPSPNGIWGYHTQSIKLPQSEDHDRFLNLV